MLYAAASLLFLCCQCSKKDVSDNLSTYTPNASFKQFFIPKGAHYATENKLKPVETAALKFIVKFDSSAIYHTADPKNQDDINKLYGFSDNGDQHHLYSARFGWRWSNGALRLFAYTYNNGVRDSKELGVVDIGKEVECAIEVNREVYSFALNGKVETMARSSSTPVAKGYQLYPYFGGDETAPHDVRIWILESQ